MLGWSYCIETEKWLSFRGEESESDSTSTATIQRGDCGAGVPRIPYLLIRTELCGRTLKQWLEKHEKRKRQLLLSFFEQVSTGCEM